MHEEKYSDTVVGAGRRKLWLLVAIVSALALSIVVLTHVSPASANNGMIQISGYGVLDLDGTLCPHQEDYPYFYAVRLYGDLAGCQYVNPEWWSCTPSGHYNEVGTEYYVIDGERFGSGTFLTSYRFTGKFEDCEDFTTEIFGRCQHPLIPGFDTGVFEDASGRLDFKDDVETGISPYRGHLRLPNWDGTTPDGYVPIPNMMSQGNSGGC